MKKCRKCFFPLYAKVVECFGKYKQIREPFPFVLYIISPKIFFFFKHEEHYFNWRVRTAVFSPPFLPCKTKKTQNKISNNINKHYCWSLGRKLIRKCAHWGTSPAKSAFTLFFKARFSLVKGRRIGVGWWGGGETKEKERWQGQSVLWHRERERERALLLANICSVHSPEGSNPHHQALVFFFSPLQSPADCQNR